MLNGIDFDVTDRANEGTESYQCPVCQERHYHWQAPCHPKKMWCADCGDSTLHSLWRVNGSHFEKCTICGLTFEQVGLNYVRRIA